MSQRLIYQKQFAKGRVVNIGCGEIPVDFGPDAVHVDMDLYNHANFVQADAHSLPFKDDEFDTAILGDIIEHVEEPWKVLKEAGRVAKVVVATIYEEWRLPGRGKHVEAALEMARKGLESIGYKTQMDYLKSLPSHKDKIVEVRGDQGNPHHYHIWQFHDEDIHQMVKDAGLEMMIYRKFPEGQCDGRMTYNWLVVAKKKED